MFKLFKKKEQEQEIMVVDNTPRDYPAIVHQIHQEFFSASDIILQEAEAILKEADVTSMKKGKRLASLGFKQAREAKESADKEYRIQTAQEIASLTMYYRQAYPFYKFITEEKVEAICKKYNLVLGTSNRYKGFVPEKNLKDIEAFRLKAADIGVYITGINPYVNSSRPTPSSLFIKGAKAKYNNGYFHLYKDGEEKHAYQSEDGEDFYASDRNNIFGLRHLGDIKFNIQNGFMICAPLKDMDTTGMKLNSYRLEKEIPDPVVLQPIQGGFLVITAWGDEASDVEIVNETMN